MQGSIVGQFTNMDTSRPLAMQATPKMGRDLSKYYICLLVGKSCSVMIVMQGTQVGQQGPIVSKKGNLHSTWSIRSITVLPFTMYVSIQALGGPKGSSTSLNETLMGLQSPLMGRQMRLMGRYRPLMGRQRHLMCQQMHLMDRQKPLMGQQRPLVGQQSPRMCQQRPMMVNKGHYQVDKGL